MRGMTWDHPRGYGPLRAYGGGVTWDAQPLEDFEAKPLRELAEHYDLLVIDHPGLGAALAGHALLPLDEVFDEADLAGWQATTIGATWRSYTVDGRLWALPIDAATQVSVYRPDRLDRPPVSWAEVGPVVRAEPSALCLGGPHAMLTLLALAQAPGGAELLAADRAVAALELLRELWPLVDRKVSLGNPIAVHEAMTAGDLAYCPLAYGYASYARPEPGRHALAWADAPTGSEDKGFPLSVLGGTGLAVTTRAADRLDQVRAWARGFLDPEVQAGLVPDYAGQPADAIVWAPGPVDRAWGHYYTSTVRSVTHALVRPRYEGWIAVQDAGSEIVRECVTGALSPADAVTEIERLFP
jgi:multiple sugar transport system substrate-binding protein